MKFLERKDIDQEKWDARIAKNSTENIFCYTWYLDAVAENWGGLISDDDYSTILAVPYTVKLGVKRFYQAPFTREYDIFGSDFSWEEALPFLSKQISHFSFRNKTIGILKESETRLHQWIDLNETTETEYRSNAKRLIKKGNKQFTFEPNENPDLLIQLFKDTVAHKIDSIRAEDLISLDKLMRNAQAKRAGEMIVAKDETGMIVAGGFFLKDKNRITYLKGASLDEAKKSGAMYALIHFGIERYRETFDILDFGGSDIENVATFYKKFGATDRKYYNYTLDETPFWFKTLKKIKK